MTAEDLVPTRFQRRAQVCGVGRLAVSLQARTECLAPHPTFNLPCNRCHRRFPCAGNRRQRRPPPPQIDAEPVTFEPFRQTLRQVEAQSVHEQKTTVVVCLDQRLPRHGLREERAPAPPETPGPTRPATARAGGVRPPRRILHRRSAPRPAPATLRSRPASRAPGTRPPRRRARFHPTPAAPRSPDSPGASVPPPSAPAPGGPTPRCAARRAPARGRLLPHTPHGVRASGARRASSEPCPHPPRSGRATDPAQSGFCRLARCAAGDPQCSRSCRAPR